MIIFSLSVATLALAAAEPKTFYYICSSQDSSSGKTIVYVGEPIAHRYDPERAVEKAFKLMVEERHGIRLPYAGCAAASSVAEARDALQYVLDFAAKRDAASVVIRWAPQAAKSALASGEAVPPFAPVSEVGETHGDDLASRGRGSAETNEDPAAARKRAHEEVEARNRERQESYEAALAEQKQKVVEFERAKEEVARKKAEQTSAAEAALARHRLEMEEHARTLVQHQDARQRHALCTAGDQSACSEPGVRSVAGEPEPRQASTNDDPRQCVTSPVVSASKTWNNALQAVVFNGCRQAVDVRICFLRTGGKWNCGVQWGVKPQDKWLWWSTQTTGEIFWDARSTGSEGVALRSPQ